MSADAGETMDQGNILHRAARVLLDAKPFPVLTGAGISVESGIPTFHGPGGLWSRYDPDEYGHIDTFRLRPERTWELLMEIIRGSIGAMPNDAHLLLADMERRGIVGQVITQNVDGLHTIAGSRDVIELHGNARTVRCLKCGNREVLEADTMDTFQIHCFCGGMKKPEVVLYGEELPVDSIQRAREICAGSRAVLVIGTSGIVYPAAALPEVVRRSGGIVIEINPLETAMTNGTANMSLKMGAVEGVRSLYDAMGAKSIHISGK